MPGISLHQKFARSETNFSTIFPTIAPPLTAKMAAPPSPPSVWPYEKGRRGGQYFRGAGIFLGFADFPRVAEIRRVVVIEP